MRRCWTGTSPGYRPFEWRLHEPAGVARPDVGPVPARVPGSVQWALRAAGIMPDWNMGFGSRACEWVEHRHWGFTTRLAAGSIPKGHRAVLAADGLDYAGWVLVDGREVDRFEGMLVSHRFDLSQALGDGRAHELTLLFDMPPREQGQFGFTSQSRHFKSRYNYSWDWCPRIVPIGIWDAIRVETGMSADLRLTRLRATLDERLEVGLLAVELDVDRTNSVLEATVEDDGEIVGRSTMPLDRGVNAAVLDGLRVTPWQPNGMGEQKLYTVRLTAKDGDGDGVWSTTRCVGFRRIEWRACGGASDDAAPWLCTVNGEPVFLQGANWVPPKALYADTTPEDYRRLISLYRDMGANVLRVWGGAILEKECFYDLCDEAGILVWQEFPLSSSGVDNMPPDNPEAIAALETIAASYIERRGHHAALLLWSGGNELQTANHTPVDESHPCIAALQDVVARDDPGRRFVPASPSGPRFGASEEDYGKGIHHDVHGPWGLGEKADLDAWRRYWEDDDALFRSEVGMPAACAIGLLERYAGGEALWPPTTPYWHHLTPWWTQWEHYSEELGELSAEEGLRRYVERTQAVQAEAYGIAARACKARFPRCGGFIIWMGHDCYPCPANNAVIDVDRGVKPAYYALKDVFTAPPEKLRSPL